MIDTNTLVSWRDRVGATSAQLARRGGPRGIRYALILATCSGVLAAGGMLQQRIERTGAAQAQAQALLAARSAELVAARLELARMRAGVDALSTTVAATARRIEARQDAMAAALQGRHADVRRAAAALGVADGGDARLDRAAGALSPGARAVLAPLLAAEARQNALLERATTAARARYMSAAYTFRALGLDPRRFTRSSRIAVGGPLEPVRAEGAAEPADAAAAAAKVRAFYTAWSRLAELGEAAASIPSRTPAGTYNFTSTFGVRYDPFTGGSAVHAGVDMAGPTGQPIVASAAGTVVRAGWYAGYGNCVDVAHGNGLMTRYGHLSRVRVRVGDRLNAGEMLGAMGSTGRSTGPHLHFEVRVDGRAVDPMPYLRAMPQIAEMQAAAPATAMGGPLGLAGRP